MCKSIARGVYFACSVFMKTFALCHIKYYTFHMSISHFTCHMSSFTYHISMITFHTYNMNLKISDVTFYMFCFSYHISYITFLIWHLSCHSSMSNLPCLISKCFLWVIVDLKKKILIITESCNFLIKVFYGATLGRLRGSRGRSIGQRWFFWAIWTIKTMKCRLKKLKKLNPDIIYIADQGGI